VNTPQGVINDFKKPILSIKSGNMLQLLKDLAAWDGKQDAYPFGEFHHVVLKEAAQEKELREYLAAKGYSDLEIKNTRPDIEDCFMALMKNNSPLKNEAGGVE
jgi:hypothetical protein